MLNKTLAAILLCVCTAPVWAEWEPVFQSNNVTHYIDSTSTEVVGDLRRISMMQDLKVRDGNGVLSYRVLEEYDCKEAKRRTLSFSSHTGNMGKGDVVVSVETPGKWSAASPRTAGEHVMKLACVK